MDVYYTTEITDSVREKIADMVVEHRIQHVTKTLSSGVYYYSDADGNDFDTLFNGLWSGTIVIGSVYDNTDGKSLGDVLGISLLKYSDRNIIEIHFAGALSESETGIATMKLSKAATNEGYPDYPEEDQ